MGRHIITDGDMQAAAILIAVEKTTSSPEVIITRYKTILKSLVIAREEAEAELNPPFDNPVHTF